MDARTSLIGLDREALKTALIAAGVISSATAAEIDHV